MRVLEPRRAHAAVPRHRDEAGEGLGEPRRVAQVGLEETLLARAGPRGLEAEAQGGDGRGRAHGLEVGVQHPQERVGAAGRLGRVEAAFVPRAVVEHQGEAHRACDEVGGGEPEDELVDKASQEEEQRLEGLDPVPGLDRLLEHLRRRGEGEDAFAPPGRAIPEGEAGLAEPAADLLPRQVGETPERVHAPAREHLREPRLRFEEGERQPGEEGAVVLDHEDFPRGPSGAPRGEPRRVGMRGEAGPGREPVGRSKVFEESPRRLPHGACRGRARQVEGADARGRGLHPRGEGEGGVEEQARGGRLGRARAGADREGRQAGERLRGRHPRGRATRPRLRARRKQRGPAGAAFDHGDRPARQRRFEPHDRLHGEVGDEQDGVAGEGHGAEDRLIPRRRGRAWRPRGPPRAGGRARG